MWYFVEWLGGMIRSLISQFDIYDINKNTVKNVQEFTLEDSSWDNA